MMRFLLSLTIFILLLSSCQENDRANDQTDASALSSTEEINQDDQNPSYAQFVKQTVNPPAPEAAPAFTEFIVEPTKGKTFNLPTGTQLIIPANAFVYDNGQTVEEEVTIQFREFHTAADIMLSGIPMRDWSVAEKWENMLTAGMFEVRGTTRTGVDVQIAPGQSLTVDLASGVEGTYDFWLFDEENGDWLNQGSNTAQPMPANRTSTAANNKSGRPARPTKPVRFSSDQPALDFDVDYSEFPALADQQGVIF
ncbi:MAG: hypothetical protein AAFU03_19100, partial [Bacteroidota bacterium]